MTKQGIKLDNISFSYDHGTGASETALFSGFSMDLPGQSVSVILGPSGCGKTTLLNLINGLLSPQQGIISRSGNASVLFQEPRLLPWRTVRQNIKIVLQKHYGEQKSLETAEHYLQLVGLGDFMDYYPDRLSGGMRQRAAIARAFAYPAETILMDEPFQALDLGLKISLAKLFTRLWIEDSRTAVFVTHDINEAVLLGNEIYVLSPRRPVGIIEHLSNTEPHAGRRLDSETSITLEKKLYRLLS